MTTPQAPEKIYISKLTSTTIYTNLTGKGQVSYERMKDTDIEYLRSDLVESKPVPGMSLQECKDKVAQKITDSFRRLPYKDWREMELALRSKKLESWAVARMTEAAELYAKQQQGSKWEKGEELLREALLQIEYLHSKFKETGTGNAVIAQIKAFLPQQ